MPAYVPTGPWTNGRASGISAALLETLESWIQQAEGATGSSAINGSTSGTATLYQVFQGVFKIVLVQTVNFRNGGGSAQTLAIPTPFTSLVVLGKNSNINPFQVLKSGTAQTVNQLITLNSGASNGVFEYTTLQANWKWHLDTGPDAISFNSSPARAVGGNVR